MQHLHEVVVEILVDWVFIGICMLFPMIFGTGKSIYLKCILKRESLPDLIAQNGFSKLLIFQRYSPTQYTLLMFPCSTLPGVKELLLSPVVSFRFNILIVVIFYAQFQTVPIKRSSKVNSLMFHHKKIHSES